MKTTTKYVLQASNDEKNWWDVDAIVEKSIMQEIFEGEKEKAHPFLSIIKPSYPPSKIIALIPEKYYYECKKYRFVLRTITDEVIGNGNIKGANNMSKKKNTRSPIDPPTMEELSCLIGWPSGTNGETSELNAIKTYMELCKANGWGRMAQLANSIDDIWRHPGNDKIYKKQQAKRFKLMKWPPYKFEDK